MDNSRPIPLPQEQVIVEGNLTEVDETRLAVIGDILPLTAAPTTLPALQARKRRPPPRLTPSPTPIWILLDDRRQGWHDKLADTVVVYDWDARLGRRLRDWLARQPDTYSTPAVTPVDPQDIHTSG